MDNKVKEYREKAKLTQEQLSEKAKVSRTTISLLETKVDTNLTYETMQKISEALGEEVPTIFFTNQAQNIVQSKE